MVGKDGQAVMPYGVMGGHYQPMGHSWFLTTSRQYGLDIQEAIDLPRLPPMKGKLQIERGIPADAGAVDQTRARAGGRGAPASAAAGDLDRPRLAAA